MREPPSDPAGTQEGLQRERGHELPGYEGREASEVPNRAERAPSLHEVATRRRALGPHDIAVGHPEREEHDRRGVSDERGVERAEPVAAGPDQRGEHDGSDRAGDTRGNVHDPRCRAPSRRSERALPPGHVPPTASRGRCAPTES